MSPFCSCNVPTSSQFCRRAPAGFRLPVVACTPELSFPLGGPLMRAALLQLLSDFLSAIVFLVLYLLTDSVTLATSIAIAVSLAQFAYLKWRARPIDAMQ